MELGTQIKKHRQALEWSQETLAEKSFVSRQTISNWENDKSYPDIQSLLLLSTLFNVSLDQLVKGDVDMMKEQVTNQDVRRFNRSATILAILFVMVVLAVPLISYKQPFGVVAWAVLFLLALGHAIYVEKEKKRLHIQTYREILAFMNGEPVDEIRKSRNVKREFRLKLLVGFVFALICAGCAALFYWLFAQ